MENETISLDIPVKPLTESEVGKRNGAQVAMMFKYWAEITEAMDPSRVFDRESSEDKNTVFSFLFEQGILEDWSNQYNSNPEQPLELNRDLLHRKQEEAA